MKTGRGYRAGQRRGRGFVVPRWVANGSLEYDKEVLGKAELGPGPGFLVERGEFWIGRMSRIPHEKV
jgi:hypothetical protein